jgi:23S rRNA (cytidine2498-2'-O)-methyltransferase
MDGLLCYCRQGFEPELAAELGERAALAGWPGYAKAERNAGYVQFFARMAPRCRARCRGAG